MLATRDFCIGWDALSSESLPETPFHEGQEATKEEMLKQLEGKIAKWWTPDDVAFVEAIPLGATGKINKLALRDMFKDYKLPTA